MNENKGRIRYYENGEANSYAIMEEPEDGRWLLTLLHNGCDVSERQRDNLRRLVACWNACDGIKTGILESITLVGDTLLKRFAERDKIELELTTQRDELLEALKEMVAMMDSGDEHGSGSQWHNKARAAINKVTWGDE